VTRSAVRMPDSCRPRVTVLMSVFNGEHYVESAINSILSQTFLDYEFLIINDGSNDNTGGIIERYNDPRIAVIHNKVRIGLTKSLNIGLRSALGEYIARHDCDDVSTSHRLADQVRYLDEHEEVTIVGGQFRLIDSNGSTLPTPPIKKAPGMRGILLHLAIDNPFVHSAVMFRKKAVLELGGYNEEYQTSQDIELWSRLLCRHEGANLTSQVIDLRVHDKSVSAGSYRVSQGDERERTIRRGTGLMRSNVRRLFSEEQLSDEWLDLYVGVYIGRGPQSERQAKLLVRGMNNIAAYARQISEHDRRYALQLVSSKYYLMCVFLLRRFFITDALHAFILAFLADPEYVVEQLFGSALNFLKRRYAC